MSSRATSVIARDASELCSRRRPRAAKEMPKQFGGTRGRPLEAESSDSMDTATVEMLECTRLRQFPTAYANRRTGDVVASS